MLSLSWLVVHPLIKIFDILDSPYILGTGTIYSWLTCSKIASSYRHNLWHRACSPLDKSSPVSFISTFKNRFDLNLDMIYQNKNKLIIKIYLTDENYYLFCIPSFSLNNLWNISFFQYELSPDRIRCKEKLKNNRNKRRWGGQILPLLHYKSVVPSTTTVISSCLLQSPTVWLKRMNKIELCCCWWTAVESATKRSPEAWKIPKQALNLQFDQQQKPL